MSFLTIRVNAMATDGLIGMNSNLYSLIFYLTLLTSDGCWHIVSWLQSTELNSQESLSHA
jgi:hypothetical protein